MSVQTRNGYEYYCEDCKQPVPTELVDRSHLGHGTELECTRCGYFSRGKLLKILAVPPDKIATDYWDGMNQKYSNDAIERTLKAMAKLECVLKTYVNIHDSNGYTDVDTQRWLHMRVYRDHSEQLMKMHVDIENMVNSVNAMLGESLRDGYVTEVPKKD